MSLYGGKLGGADVSLSPNNVLSVIFPVSRQVAVMPKFSADDAQAIIDLLVSAEKVDFNWAVGAKAAGLEINPAVVAEWSKTDGDAWRVTGERKIILIEWLSKDVRAYIDTDWKGYLGLITETSKFLKKCIDGRGGRRSRSGRKPAEVRPIRTTILIPPDLLAYAKEKGNVSAYIARLIEKDKDHI